MIMVILVHYQQSFGICKWFHYFQMGCPMFFVASGFGIMSLINRKFDGEINTKNVKEFYLSRFKALAPGWYIAIVIVFLANTIAVLTFGSTLNFGTNRSPLSIICNLLFLQGLLPFCNNNVMPGGWYIGTTVILYALTPLILAALKKTKNRIVFFVSSSFLGMLIWLVFALTINGWFEGGFGYFFFTVHYPEYLLGILLFCFLSEKKLKEKQIKLFLPLGIISFAIAYVLFYAPISFAGYPSAWMTALGTFFVLYFLIFRETTEKSCSWFEKVLIGFGRNSYCIYLLHGFFAWTFIQILGKVFNKLGLDIHTYFWLFALIPVVLVLSYFSGMIFSKIIKWVMSILTGKKKESLV